MATTLYRDSSLNTLPSRPNPDQSRFVEDFFSSALDDEDQLQRMQSLQHHQQQQQLDLAHRPASPSLSALSFRSELVPVDRSFNGTEIEPSVVEEMYEEEGGRIERLGGKVHLRGMAKMKNELLRQQFKETEPIRQREVELHNTRDLARQTTLVNKSLARQLRDTTALLAVSHIKAGISETKSNETVVASMILKEELVRARADLGREKEEVRRAKREADELRVREKEARERLLRYAEELKVRDAKAQGRREGKEEAMEEIQRWMTSPPIPLPSSSNDHQPPQQQQQRAPSSPPRREPSPRRSSPPRRQDTLSPSYQRHEPPLSTEESLLKQTPFFSPVLPIVTPPLDRKGSVAQRSEQTHNTSSAPPPSSQQQQQQPPPPPQVIYIMPQPPASTAPPPPPPPPAQPSAVADRRSPVPPPREPSPSPQTIPRAPTTAQAPNPPLYRPSAITPPMQRQPTITRPQAQPFPQHFRPQTAVPVQDRATSRMTSISAIGGDERDINMDIWKAPSQQTGVPTGMPTTNPVRARPRPGPQPQPRTGPHTQQASWSTAGRGGGSGFGGGFGVFGGKGKERAREGDHNRGEMGLFGGDYEVLGSATKRNSKYPIHPVEIHPSRNRDAEVEYYPETRDYTAVDKDWEAVQRSLKSLPPSDSSAGGSVIVRSRNFQGLGSPLFGRDAPLGGDRQGHQRDDSRASSFRMAGPPGRVVVPPRAGPPPVQATSLAARTPVDERSRSPVPRAPSPNPRAPSPSNRAPSPNTVVHSNRGPSPAGSRPLPPNPANRPRQIVMPAPLGPNLPTSAVKHRPAQSDGGLDHGPSSLLRDPSRDKFYGGSTGGQQRGVSMYQGSSGWPGTTAGTLGLSLAADGTKGGAVGGGARDLLGSGTNRRDSVAPSINIQAPSTERSHGSRAAPSPQPVAIPLPPSVAPSRAPSRAPTIYHHSQPSYPTPSTSNPPSFTTIPAILPQGQITSQPPQPPPTRSPVPQNIRLPPSRAPTAAPDSGRGSPSSNRTSRPHPRPLASGALRRSSMDHSSTRPAVSPPPPSGGLLSPTGARNRLRALLGNDDAKPSPPPPRPIDVRGGGPSPATSPRSQPKNLSNKPTMFTLPNSAHTQPQTQPLRLPVQIPLPASRPGSTFYSSAPHVPPKDLPSAPTGGGGGRKKGYPVSMVESVDSSDSAWLGEKGAGSKQPRLPAIDKAGSAHGSATPRYRPRPPTLNGGGTVASTIEEESESDAKRSRLSKERSRDR